LTGFRHDGARSAIGYEARAIQIRAEAENISNPQTKKAMLRIADNYEQLAIRVSKRPIST